MRAVKGNKEYTISEAQKKFYQDAGYDIKDEKGKVLAYGRGKTVPYGDYAALKVENEELKAKVAELETAQNEKQEAAPEGKAKTGKKAGE